MPVLFSNTASATLASSITSSSTTITVSTGLGALFPATPSGSYFYATLVDSSNNLEIVKVTTRSADSMTVARAQEGTTARSYAAADKIELRITAAGLGNFVQLDGAQTLTGVKTFSNGLVANVTGNLTGNVTGNVTGNITGSSGSCTGNAATATTTPKLLTTNFSVEQASGKLQFKYGSTVIASLDSSGNFTTASTGDITAYGTP